MPNEKPETGIFARLFARVSAARGKPVTTPEEAEDAVEQMHQEHITATTFAREVGQVLGTSETPKAVEQIRQLQRDAAAEKSRREAAERTARETGIASVLTKFEAKLTPTTKKLYRIAIERDLAAGQQLGATTTEAMLLSLRPGPAGEGQRAAGGNAASRVVKGNSDEQIDTAARETIEATPELKELAKNDWPTAYQRAIAAVGKSIRLAQSAGSADHPDAGEGDEEGADEGTEEEVDGEEESVEGVEDEATK